MPKGIYKRTEEHSKRMREGKLFWKNKTKKPIKCQMCKTLTFNKKLCSMSCTQKYFKKYKINIYNFKVQSKAGKIGAAVCKKKKIGAFNDPNLRKKISSKGGRRCREHHPNQLSEMGKRTHELHPTQASESGKKVRLIHEKNKTGPFYDPKLNRQIRLNTVQNIGTYVFNNIHFDSRSEMEFALNIHYQLEKLKLWKNYQVVIDLKRIDFYIKKFNCFIEYHPYCRKETSDSYYKKRRKILNDGGFKASNLLIIT